MNMENPAKQAAGAGTPTTLTSLLTELNGGKVLDLTVMAAIKVTRSTGDENDDDTVGNVVLSETILKLFTYHVGKSPEIVITNAIRHAKDELEMEIEKFNKIQRRMYCGDEHAKHYNFPLNRFIKGPKPDTKILLKLFMGEESADALLADTELMNGRKDEEIDAQNTEGVTYTALRKEVSQISTIELLTNILQYTRKEAGKVSPIDLLKFSVLYGLDGVMNDIIKGCYGGETGELTVNTFLPLNDEAIEDVDHEDTSSSPKLFYPAYALAAILGHANVVESALSYPVANIDKSVGYQYGYDEEMIIRDNNHNLPSEVFSWVFQKNMPEMMTYLVNKCGFQFRWIDHTSSLPMMFSRIFDDKEWDSTPKWKGATDEEDLMWENSRGRHRLRAASAYKEQMKMLDLLISLGFPFSLFFPVDPPFEREEKLMNDKKLETQQEVKAYMRSMSKEERESRERAYQACCGYNTIQESEPETLTLGDYYRKLKARWDGQEEQTDRLLEFEVLDSRWRETQPEQNGEGDMDNSSQSYHDSDDGSSYGDPPGM